MLLNRGRNVVRRFRVDVVAEQLRAGQHTVLYVLRLSQQIVTIALADDGIVPVENGKRGVLNECDR